MPSEPYDDYPTMTVEVRVNLQDDPIASSRTLIAAVSSRYRRDVDGRIVLFDETEKVSKFLGESLAEAIAERLGEGE